MVYYVDANAANNGKGSKDCPFLTIQEAADIALPGDEVHVLPGIYRENVNPKHAGKEDARIVYKSVEHLKAVISGAERIGGWVSLGDGVWTSEIYNDFFGAFNPYKEIVKGDWFIAFMTAHLGDVYLNGKSMYEVTDLDQVKHPEVSKASWDKEFSLYKWFARADEEKTVFYANFGELDPNEQTIEISVRPNCFYPQEEGIGFITLSGFTLCHAATQWAPPTAYQEGMVGPHWSKGWIIEDCDIFESKCSGISLGKYEQKNNDNKWLKWKYKDGTQTERECICQAQYEGWTKEKIGHHIVRRCSIHDCGQTGIVGHLGGVFSLIEENHIYNINNKQNLAGAEIGGIKMHAAIDCVYRKNVIHHCTRGLWLDWQAQGTRVTQNLFYDNMTPNVYGKDKLECDVFETGCEDIFIEVSHGPTLVDNNIMLSPRSVKLAAQGTAFVHNIIGGSFVLVGGGTDNGAKTMSSPRYTPYHVPHRTEVAGFMTFLHGDVRFYNNIFIQQEISGALKEAEKIYQAIGVVWDDGFISTGTMRYDGYPTFEEWDKMFEGYCGMGSDPSDRYYSHLPVWSGNNVYFNGAQHWEKEEGAFVDNQHEVYVKVLENMVGEEPEDNGLKEGMSAPEGCEKTAAQGFCFRINSAAGGFAGRIESNVFDYIKDYNCRMISTETLGMAFEPEQPFENPDGSAIIFDEDFLGNKRKERIIPGPVTL